MTGAPLPDGADAVLPIENAQIDGQRVLVMGEVSPGKHVGQIGEDVRAGDVVERAGRVLRPQDIGMLSSLGFSHAPVIRRPRVRILITGNELLPMGTPPEGFRITDANGPMLAALVTRDGGEPITGPIVPDDRDAILAALREAGRCRPGLRRLERRPGRPCADVVGRARRTGRSRHRDAAQQSHGHGPARRPAGVPAAGKSRVVPVCL